MQIDLIGSHGGSNDDEVSEQFLQNWYIEVSPDTGKPILMPTPFIDVEGFSKHYWGADSFGDKLYQTAADGIYEDSTLIKSLKFNGYSSFASSAHTTGDLEPVDTRFRQIVIVDDNGAYICNPFYSACWSLLGALTWKESAAATPTANKLETRAGSVLTIDFTNASIGMSVKNVSTGAYAKVTAIDSSSILSLDADIFLVGNELYEVNYQSSSGTTTSNSLNRLIDATAKFISEDIQPGMTVKNGTTGVYAFVVSTDSETQLTISADIFQTFPESYEVGKKFDWCAKSDDYGEGVEFMDGFFITDVGTGGSFQISEYYDAQRISPLDFATAERSPDPIKKIIRINRNLLMIGSESSEVWYNTGGQYFPFSPHPAGARQWGTRWPGSWIRVGDTAMGLGVNRNGDIKLLIANGLDIRPVINSQLEAEITKLGLPTNMRASLYEEGGNVFYCINVQASTFVGLGGTDESYSLVYNVTTGLMHTWKDPVLHQNATGEELPHIIYNNGQYHVFVLGVTEEKAILSKSLSAYEGEEIVRIRRSKTIENSGRLLQHSKLTIVPSKIHDYGTYISASTAGTGFSFITIEDIVDKRLDAVDVNLGVDMIENIDTGDRRVILSTAPAIMGIDAGAAISIGDKFKIINGTTFEQLYPRYTVSAKWKDKKSFNAGQTKGYYTKTEKVKPVRFLRLGSSMSRVYEIKVTGNIMASIESMWVDVK